MGEFIFPKIVAVKWCRKVHADDLGPNQAPNKMWWVMGDCEHFRVPVMKTQKGKHAPASVACYKCKS